MVQRTSSSETVPYDREAEQSVLGAILRDPACAADVIALLEADDFYLPRNRRLFELLRDLDQRSPGACDPVTVAAEIERLRLGEELGGRSWLVELMTSVPSGAFLENHVEVLRALAIRRGLLRASEEIQRLVHQSDSGAQDLVNDAEHLVFRVGDRLVGSEIQSTQTLIRDNIEKILHNAHREKGLATGFADLDERQGFRPGDLVVLAARPSMGKTALALNIVERVAMAGKAVLFFSLEMPNDQILLRLLSARSRVRHDVLRRGRVDASDRHRLSIAAGELAECRIYLDDSSQPTLAEIRAKARRLKRDGHLDLIVLDYMQLLQARAENRQQEISIISRTLKSLARDLKVPVLALAQLNRAAERRDSHRPMLSDLRESGSIEQDADMVMLLFREEYYNETEENRGLAELIIAKNRNGATGTVTLRFAQDQMRFENAWRQAPEGL